MTCSITLKYNQNNAIKFIEVPHRELYKLSKLFNQKIVGITDQKYIIIKLGKNMVHFYAQARKNNFSDNE